MEGSKKGQIKEPLTEKTAAVACYRAGKYVETQRLLDILV